jgi:hypothetical protein
LITGKGNKHGDFQVFKLVDELGKFLIILQALDGVEIDEVTRGPIFLIRVEDGHVVLGKPFANDIKEVFLHHFTRLESVLAINHLKLLVNDRRFSPEEIPLLDRFRKLLNVKAIHITVGSDGLELLIISGLVNFHNGEVVNGEE